MSRLLVLGDIHGSHRALVQVLERANVDRDNDRVIFLGDVCDGWPDTRQCIDELLTLKKLVAIRGNHDEWALRWMLYGWTSFDWLSQGGRATVESYGHDYTRAQPTHTAFIANAKLWHQEEDRIFVHGGWDFLTHSHPMAEDANTLMWDRTLWETAQAWDVDGAGSVTRFSEVYIGHTATELSHPDLLPVKACEVWNVDQGCGWGGKLTLMDVDTKEYWQSDRSRDLYPDDRGRFA